jgi:hypothetical protein
MKIIAKTFLIALGMIFSWISIFPTVTLADNNEDCNRFWAKCHVEDIQTYHTDDEDVSSWLLDTIKNAINWCLWILATVVLCFCMYWWFKMLTSGWDSKWYDAGWKILKNALIWLAIILLAWMIVSVVLWFVATLSDWNQTWSDTHTTVQ